MTNIHASGPYPTAAQTAPALTLPVVVPATPVTDKTAANEPERFLPAHLLTNVMEHCKHHRDRLQLAQTSKSAHEALRHWVHDHGLPDTTQPVATPDNISRLSRLMPDIHPIRTTEDLKHYIQAIPYDHVPGAFTYSKLLDHVRENNLSLAEFERLERTPRRYDLHQHDFRRAIKGIAPERRHQIVMEALRIRQSEWLSRAAGHTLDTLSDATQEIRNFLLATLAESGVDLSCRDAGGMSLLDHILHRIRWGQLNNRSAIRMFLSTVENLRHHRGDSPDIQQQKNRQQRMIVKTIFSNRFSRPDTVSMSKDTYVQDDFFKHRSRLLFILQGAGFDVSRV